MKAEHATTARQEQQVIQRNAAAQRSQSQGGAQAQAPEADLFAQLLQENLAPVQNTPAEDSAALPGDGESNGNEPLLEDPALAGLVPPKAQEPTPAEQAAPTLATLLPATAASEVLTNEEDALNSAAARAQDNAPARPGSEPPSTVARNARPGNAKAAQPATPAVAASAEGNLAGKAIAATPAVPADNGSTGWQTTLQWQAGHGQAIAPRGGQSPAQGDAASTPTALAAAPASASVRTDAGTTGGSGGPDLGAGPLSSQDSGAPASTETDATATQSFAEHMDQAMQDAFETLGAQVSVWASQNTKRAAMRLDAGLREALDVDITLKDGRAHIHFRTDDAQAREAIRAQAQGILADLLARQGMDLGGVSVSAQGGHGDGRSAGQQESPPGWRGLHRALDRVQDMGGSAQAVEIRPGSQRALDIYA